MDMGRVYNKHPEGLAAYPFHGRLVSYAHYTVALSSISSLNSVGTVKGDALNLAATAIFSL